MRLAWDTERDSPPPIQRQKRGQQERYIIISGFISKCSVVTSRKKETKQMVNQNVGVVQLTVS